MVLTSMYSCHVSNVTRAQQEHDTATARTRSVFKEVVENVSFENPKGRYFKVSLNPDRCNNMRYVESHGSARCSTLELELELDPLVVFI